MDREAFKQRMQALKTYRESNPGKSYLDWKVQSLENGGEVGDPDEKFAKRFYLRAGRTEDGRPIEQPLKSVFDLEDAANFTPIGDALAVKDTYNAVKESDWTGAGLAAIGALPFIPSGLKAVRKGTKVDRAIPTVIRNEQKLIDLAIAKHADNANYISDVANAKNRIFEDLNTVPYRARAIQADGIFGTKYNETYDLLDDLYEGKFFDLPAVLRIDNVDYRGRMQASEDATNRFFTTGKGAGPSDFEFLVNPMNKLDPAELAQHELGHYTDYLISRNPNTSINNPMLSRLSKSLNPKPVNPKLNGDYYYRKGTELKSFMNLARVDMNNRGLTQLLDEIVSPYELENYMKTLKLDNPIVKAFNEHNSSKHYAKWFNSIPLLGAGAIGINNYFNKE